jgi:hypothetical protein
MPVVQAHLCEDCSALGCVDRSAACIAATEPSRRCLVQTVALVALSPLPPVASHGAAGGADFDGVASRFLQSVRWLGRCACSSSVYRRVLPPSISVSVCVLSFSLFFTSVYRLQFLRCLCLLLLSIVLSSAAGAARALAALMYVRVRCLGSGECGGAIACRGVDQARQRHHCTLSPCCLTSVPYPI